MWTSTKHGEWKDAPEVLGYLRTAFKSIRANASASMEIARRVREMLGNGDEDAMNPSSDVKHLRRVQPMDEDVAEGVLGFGDTLEWAEREIRRMVIEKDESTAEAAKEVAQAVEVLGEWCEDNPGYSKPGNARGILKCALRKFRENPNVDATLEMDGVQSGGGSDDGSISDEDLQTLGVLLHAAALASDGELANSGDRTPRHVRKIWDRLIEEVRPVYKRLLEDRGITYSAPGPDPDDDMAWGLAVVNEARDAVADDVEDDAA